MESPLTQFGKAAQGLARNPLGIIALFIVLVYGIAALVLSTSIASLQPAERAPLVWFLVVFPIVVLGVFGWLVSRHHSKLYAPRDFHSDAGFLKTLTPEAQRARLDAEVAALELDTAEKQADAVVTREPPLLLSPPTVGDPQASLMRGSNSDNATRARARANVLIAQELALRQLELELGTPLDRQAAVSAKGVSTSFDGVVVQDGNLTGVEVKLLRRATARRGLHSVLESALEGMSRLYAASTSKDRVRFVLALVLDEIPREDRDSLRERVSKVVEERGIPVEIRTYDLQELQERFGVPAT